MLSTTKILNDVYTGSLTGYYSQTEVFNAIHDETNKALKVNVINLPTGSNVGLATIASLNASTASYKVDSGSFNTRINNLSAISPATFNLYTGSFNSYTSSNNTALTTKVDTGSFNSLTESYLNASGGFDSRITSLAPDFLFYTALNVTESFIIPTKCPAKYAVTNGLIVNSGSGAVILEIGSIADPSDFYSSTLNAGETKMTDAITTFYSLVEDTDLIVTSSDFNGASLNIYLKFTKLVG